jgi:hypothetical protein
VLGAAPKLEAGVKEWLKFQKRKWQLQLEFRQDWKASSASDRAKANATNGGSNGGSIGNISRSITNFVQKTANTKMQKPWQILRISEQPNSAG